MGACCARDTACEAWWRQADGGSSRGVHGPIVRVSSGFQGRSLAKGLPPRSTVHGYFVLWNYDGTLDRLHHVLYVKCREKADRDASPTAAIIDSQSVKSAEKGGAASTPMAMLRARTSKERS